jgi:hypothetical protein
LSSHSCCRLPLWPLGFRRPRLFIACPSVLTRMRRGGGGEEYLPTFTGERGAARREPRGCEPSSQDRCCRPRNPPPSLGWGAVRTRQRMVTRAVSSAIRSGSEAPLDVLWRRSPGAIGIWVARANGPGVLPWCAHRIVRIGGRCCVSRGAGCHSQVGQRLMTPSCHGLCPDARAWNDVGSGV